MTNRTGAPIWFELTTEDADQAQGFYEAVLGWSVVPSPMPEHHGYRIASARDGQGVGGIMKPPPGMPGVPGWAVYFASNDVDADAGRVKELGGEVKMGPMDIPHVGRFAVVTDPQGVPFMLMTGASPEDSTAFKQMAGEAGLGHGVWIELATPDPDGALAFYGKLFGWSKLGAMPMGAMGEYAFIGWDEEARPGAVMSSTTTHAPARWNWYVQVADIDAAIAAAKARGGAVLQGPDPIPGGDYSANLKDAAGLQIGIVGPRK